MRFLRGQAAIALTLAIPVIVGASCIGADMRVLYRTSTRLQQATDAAVQCGAAYLPANPALAEITARSRARTSGIREDEIIYSRPAADRRSITMVVERKVSYRFARLLGLSQGLVTVKAMAVSRSSQSAAGLLPIGISANFAWGAWGMTSTSNSVDRLPENSRTNKTKRNTRYSVRFHLLQCKNSI
jgi:hypothetical protein